jgi:hypothetical protein
MLRLGAVMVVITLGALLAMRPQAVMPEINEQNFDKLVKHILPTKQECRWQEIPWRNTFWDAVQEANRAEKPILLWGMNGHPLGCT